MKTDLTANQPAIRITVEDEDELELIRIARKVKAEGFGGGGFKVEGHNIVSFTEEIRTFRKKI